MPKLEQEKWKDGINNEILKDEMKNEIKILVDRMKARKTGRRIKTSKTTKNQI